MRRMGCIWTWREEAAGAFWDEARTVLKRNGVIAVPTETFFGLAVNPFQEEALDRLFALKDRAPGKPVLLLVDETGEAQSGGSGGPWFGPAAYGKILARTPDHYFQLPHLPRLLTGGTGTIAVRQPRQALTCRLIAALGFPITGTSANRAGGRPGIRAEEVAREFGDHLDLILEAGPCPGGLPSTIVDVTEFPPRLVRAGAIPAAELAEIMPEPERIPAGGRQVNEPAVMSMDLGGKPFGLAVVSPQGKILSRWERATATMPDEGRPWWRPWWLTSPRADAAARESGWEIKAGGIGVPGRVFPREGRVVFSPNVAALNDCHLVDRLTPLVGSPLFLENNAQPLRPGGALTSGAEPNMTICWGSRSGTRGEAATSSTAGCGAAPRARAGKSGA